MVSHLGPSILKKSLCNNKIEVFHSKERGINKLNKIYAVILTANEAKNVGDAEHRRGFLTKLAVKITRKEV